MTRDDSHYQGCGKNFLAICLKGGDEIRRDDANGPQLEISVDLIHQLNNQFY